MRGIGALLATAVVTLGSAHLLAAPDAVTRTVTAHAQISARSSLIVSSQVLQFSVLREGQPAVATVDFVAGVRTHAGAEVVLTVEAGGPEGAPPDTRLTFSGNGDAIVDGRMMAPGPAVAGRWIGSGRRSGRLAFALHGAATGSYVMPVRFVLSAP